MTHKFNIGQKVVYDGLLAEVESQSNYTDGRNCYGLVCLEDSELTCTADEDKCDIYDEAEELDQSKALSEAHDSSRRIAGMVDRITDKYFTE